MSLNNSIAMPLSLVDSVLHRHYIAVTEVTMSDQTDDTVDAVAVRSAAAHECIFINIIELLKELCPIWREFHDNPLSILCSR